MAKARISDIEAARRIGHILAKGLLQMKQIKGKVEDEGK